MERYKEYKDSGNYIIGMIPKGWDLVKLKFLCSGFNNGTTAAQVDYAEDTISVTRIESISEGVINYKKVGYVIKDANLESYKLNKGDILLSHINSYERVGNTAVYDSDIELYHGMNLLRLTPKDNICKDYLYIFLKSRCFILQMQRTCKPAINQVSVPSKVIKNLNITYPPLLEQERIASYIKSKTSKIDQYIAEKEKEVRLLNELKEAEIAKVVTQGLNPNVKMKDSGISWIGMIPEHWEVKRIASLFTGKVNTNSDFAYQHAFKFYYGTLVPKDEVGDAEEYRETYVKYQVLQKNDILINGLNLNYDFVSQRVAIAPSDGIITSAYIVARPRKGTNADYYNYLFKAMDSKKLFHGMGTGIRLTLSFDELKKYIVVCPPIDEQRAIVAYINEKTAKVESLITDLQAEIEFLKEYKQRLIADCVTGQVNVQNE